MSYKSPTFEINSRFNFAINLLFLENQNPVGPSFLGTDYIQGVFQSKSTFSNYVHKTTYPHKLRRRLSTLTCEKIETNTFRRNRLLFFTDIFFSRLKIDRVEDKEVFLGRGSFSHKMLFSL